jgi:diamine N-acetyltransferase
MNVELREITAETVREICQLEAHPPGYVAPNATSIAQAHFHPEAWFRGIYADGKPVGFVMLEDSSLRADPPAELSVSLWRFMIHRPRQRQGLGHAALTLVIAHVRQTYPALQRFGTSCMPGPHTPRPFYESLGFVATGEMDDDEEILALYL